MDENMKNPQRPEEIPEDMPALVLDPFTGEPQPQEEIPLEPLFPDETPMTAAPAEVLSADEVSEEEAAAESVPIEEAVFQETPVEDSPVEQIPLQEERVKDAPADAADSWETAEENTNQLPPRDFSEFDVPVDDPPMVPDDGVSPVIPVSVPEPEIPSVYPADDVDPVYSGCGEAPYAGDAESPADAGDATTVFTLDELGEAAYGGSDGLSPAYDEQPIESAFEDDREFADMFEGNSGSTEETPAASTAHPAIKGRPKRKKGDGLFGIPHLLATFIWLAIILAIGVSLGRMLWVCAADVLAFGRESREVVVTITMDDTIDEIAQKLQDKGLIRYTGLFKLYASIAVDDGEIAPGTYTLNTILDYHALVGQMSSSSSSRAVVKDVLIPEGYNCRQIFELLEMNGICTVAELEAYAASGEFQDFWFLEGVERGDKYCLEGYLFPDTYDFYSGSTPREALGKMLLGFQARIDQDEVTTKLAALNERLSAMMRANGCSDTHIAEHQLGLYELLTVASLIEEETASSSESPTIASVIYNRLTQDQEYERYLGIDAAIIYATGDSENIDTTIDNPYNTYKNAGLTPTPISNPGLSSINAALEFADTDYYYYVLNPETGTHQFSKTYEEHQEWIEKFKAAAVEEE